MNGILLIDKPVGITSQTVVTRVKRALNIKKAGHCGTLDPMASGVLPVMCGTAAKLSQMLTDHDKRYLAGIKLGMTTDSQDTSGNIISEYKGELPDIKALRDAAECFCGEIMQTPPMYSALKINGEKLVDLARKGIEVERQPRKINIYSLDVSETADGFFLDIHCSRGTYVRTLCADIGEKLGTGGCMSSLRRTKVGEFDIANCTTLADLENMSQDEIKSNLITPEELLSVYPEYTPQPFFMRLLKNGAKVDTRKLGMDLPVGSLVRLYDEDGFFALAEISESDDAFKLGVSIFF